MGQGEGRQPADPKALMFPGQHVISQVDFLVDHGKLDLWILTCDHLRDSDYSYELQLCYRAERSGFNCEGNHQLTVRSSTSVFVSYYKESKKNSTM